MQRLRNVQITQRQTTCKIGAKKLSVIDFTHQIYTRREAEYLIDREIAKYKHIRGLKFMPSIEVPNRGWRNSKSFNVADVNNSQIDCYGQESDEVEGLLIYAWVDNRAGGHGDSNDCLYNAIKYGVGETYLKKKNQLEKSKRSLQLRSDVMKSRN